MRHDSIAGLAGLKAIVPGPRPVLAAAADFDASGGLRTALGMLYEHPRPMYAAAVALGLAQAACIAAAANYGTGTPLVVRAKSAGYWARCAHHEGYLNVFC